LDKDTNNASHPISTKTLPKRKGDDLGDWDRYGTTALASGAFPVGLSCRRLEFSWKHYTGRQYPIPLPDGVQIAPAFPPDIEQQYSLFSFESVDGGLVNNDPFDYAQYALMGGPGEPASGESVANVVIMVAPFPEPPEFLPENSPSPAIAAIVRALFPALINQARFRTADLAPALNEDDFSRYIIAPLRRIPRSSLNAAVKPERERFAIACGLLSGFGGFLDEQFRAHDFQLGRRNCQYFLQKTFRVPANNKIVGRSGARCRSFRFTVRRPIPCHCRGGRGCRKRISCSSPGELKRGSMRLFHDYWMLRHPALDCEWRSSSAGQLLCARVF
jgi:hypothetical protein